MNYPTCTILQARRKRGAFLAEQLTLSQPGGAYYAHHSTTSPPPDFQTLRRPWSLFYGFSSFQTLTWFMTKNIWTRSKNKSILRTFKKQWLYLNLIRRNLHSGINICVKKSWIHPRFLVRKKSARTKFALVKSLVTKMHEANIQGLFWNWA